MSQNNETLFGLCFASCLRSAHLFHFSTATKLAPLDSRGKGEHTGEGRGGTGAKFYDY